ncbi:MAG: hypothetical protein HQK53_02275 [Oligoflexia bacterium]|nr:hypothetical protein [Oligoflexia bacterium]
MDCYFKYFLCVLNLLMCSTMMQTDSLNAGCGNDGDVIDLRRQGFSMEHVPVRNQKDTGSCYAVAAAQMYDAVLKKGWGLEGIELTEDQKNYRTSIVATTVENLFNNTPTGYVDSILSGQSTIEALSGGKLQSALATLSQNGSCSEEFFERKADNVDSMDRVREFMSTFENLRALHNISDIQRMDLRRKLSEELNAHFGKTSERYEENVNDITDEFIAEEQRKINALAKINSSYKEEAVRLGQEKTRLYKVVFNKEDEVESFSSDVSDQERKERVQGELKKAKEDLAKIEEEIKNLLNKQERLVNSRRIISSLNINRISQSTDKTHRVPHQTMTDIRKRTEHCRFYLISGRAPASGENPGLTLIDGVLYVHSISNGQTETIPVLNTTPEEVRTVFSGVKQFSENAGITPTKGCEVNISKTRISSSLKKEDCPIFLLDGVDGNLHLYDYDESRNIVKEYTWNNPATDTEMLRQLRPFNAGKIILPNNICEQMKSSGASVIDRSPSLLTEEQCRFLSAHGVPLARIHLQQLDAEICRIDPQRNFGWTLNNFLNNAEGILDSMINVGAKKAVNDFIGAYCGPKQRKNASFSFDTKEIGPDVSANGVFDQIDSNLEKGMNTLPIGISYHAGLLRNGRNYDNSTPGNANIIDGHASLIIGRRNIAGRCQYLVRNSWGEDCSTMRISQDFECDRGNIWVDRDTLVRNITRAVIPRV